MVIPVILYGCEIWGHRNLDILERLQLKFCKMVLKLKQATPDVMVYGESGRYKLEYYAKKRIINFWGRIISGNYNKLAYSMYTLCKHRYDSGLSSSEWFIGLVSLLNNCGIYLVPDAAIVVKAKIKE